jgi:hypothetical protein
LASKRLIKIIKNFVFLPYAGFHYDLFDMAVRQGIAGFIAALQCLTKKMGNFLKESMAKPLSSSVGRRTQRNEDGRQTSSNRKLNGFKEKHYGSRY